MALEYPHKILLVEDNMINKKIAMMMLNRLGYTCDWAENGVKAIEMVSEKENLREGYDLIFMDMQMPEMDGITAAKTLIDMYPERVFHIIPMTANVLDKDKQDCLDAGMDDFLSKPLDKAEVQRVLKKFNLKG